MNKRMKTFLIVAGAVVIVAGLCTVSRWWGLSGSVSDWFVHVEADTLVRRSDHIVIARYMDEEIHVIPDTSTAGATSPTSLDVYTTELTPLLKSLKLCAMASTLPDASPWPVGSSWTTPHAETQGWIDRTEMAIAEFLSVDPEQRRAFALELLPVHLSEQ